MIKLKKLFQLARWTEEIFARCTRGTGVHVRGKWTKEKKEEKKKKERQKERKRGGGDLSETAAIYETEWKRVLEGVRRPPPLIPPLNTAISTSQLSIRPFRILKGKFQLVRGPTFSRFRLFRRGRGQQLRWKITRPFAFGSSYSPPILLSFRLKIILAHWGTSIMIIFFIRWS